MMASMLAIIALGSNLGDRLANLRAGRDHVATLHRGTQAPAVSPIYETAPVGCPPGSPPFLNALVAIETEEDPAVLLAALSTFEEQLGRPRERERNAPRPIDLDIILVGTQQRNDPALTLPHPRAHLRRFVLQPLADLFPDLILPGTGHRVAQLLHDLPAHPEVQMWRRTW